ncbi:peptide-methionine (S)-S-oxide reductase MsrA [Gilvimarinus chinensis]|uniref:peptide-methionine (S)-S-oxide reductase MsrA n=1 Tax=Gilvimarinus chinensis TaxID=396005 RepID=UPI00035F07E7|nr:peptide-methionine (S)-S-oxide reductase MsrA [Gilvimarinus chinensis]
MFSGQDKSKMPTEEQALPGRPEPLQVENTHWVSGEVIKPPFPEHTEWFLAGLGCFWGAERCFWQEPGVFTTAVGYAAGHTPNPTYEEVCSGLTGHNEVVLVVYNPADTSFDRLLQVFWQAHDPTQGMRQGNDRGTQYRSGLYLSSEAQLSRAQASRDLYQAELRARGYGDITTEIQPAPAFYYAETYHQQYLAKNPGGYCGLGGTGVTCPGLSL